MAVEEFGRLLCGERAVLERSAQRWARQAVDWDLTTAARPAPPPARQTIARPVTVTGPGTFLSKAMRTLTFLPGRQDGWWFQRVDLPEALPTRVSVRNVWTTGDIVSNIVLRSGSPHNYVRMVEHIIALKTGLDLDNLVIQTDSGDPPIFNRGSLDLVEALESAGIVATPAAARWWTVKEPVTVVDARGAFLCLQPAAAGTPRLDVDCAVDFRDAIGRQRIRFPVQPEHVRLGATARTNTTAAKMWYCRTIGKLFADVRNLGYTVGNVLVAGKKSYLNPPRLMHEGKSLEAVWHRAALDLLAALALVEEGRLAGRAISYKSGHALDVRMITLLYLNDLLVEM